MLKEPVSPPSENRALPSGLPEDKWVKKFLQHLATDRGASIYTQRNYRQALVEFCGWHKEERHQSPVWSTLQRDDFRAYVRFLGRGNLSRAAIQLRFCALRTFYKFLLRHGEASSSPIKNISLPKLEKRLPKFLTAEQMLELLKAPLKPLEAPRKKGPGRPIVAKVCYRDVAILETIYSCGLRISELCGLNAADIDWGEQLARIRGKGKKERLVPIGSPALEAIKTYWSLLEQPPAGNAPVFLAETGKGAPLSARILQSRLKKYLVAAGLDPDHELRRSATKFLFDFADDLQHDDDTIARAERVKEQIMARDEVTTRGRDGVERRQADHPGIGGRSRRRHCAPGSPTRW